MKKKRGAFSGSIGFILAAAGSAVGLGNIWRFPYLAARDGGGLFLIIYIILALTFGFALLTSEIAIGRNTKQSPLTAYKKLNKHWGWIGIFSSVIPFLIMPYYIAIGGWVLKYFIAFLIGQNIEAAQDGYFTNFVTSSVEPVVMMVLFLTACTFIIWRGIDKGIEKSSRIIMPALILLAIIISVFSLTISNTGADGTTVAGLQGFRYYIIPSLSGISIRDFFMVIMDAVGQLFYSLSVAMGIMIAYGSYVPDNANLGKSIAYIELFDTCIAFLAGVMIIPGVFVFMGLEGMSAGPSLMFVSLPKVFAAMGPVIGRIIGTLFFAMVLFAAVTSAMSILEAVVSSLIDQFGWNRKKSTLIETCIALVIGLIVCFGYNVLYFEVTLPNGLKGQILDILDYLTNNILMPIVAIATCILIGWVLKPSFVFEEVEKNGERMGRKRLFTVMIKFVCPTLLTVLFLMSTGIL